MHSSRRLVAILAVVLPSAGAAWAQASHTDDLVVNDADVRRKGHVTALIEDVQTSAQADYVYLEAPLHWRVEQSYERGETPCAGATVQHEQLGPTTDANLLWDRHVRRTLDLGSLQRITVKTGIKPYVYITGAKFLSGTAEAHTVTISTKGSEISIEYWGYDGGPQVPRETPLFFPTYYHDLYVVTRQKAVDAAAHLQALALECGAANVQIDDLTR